MIREVLELRDIDTLKKEKEEWEDVKRHASEEILQINYERALHLIKPFKEGQEVMCKLSVGRGKPEFVKGILGIEVNETFYDLYVTPYKKDGTLSKRRFLLFVRDKESFLETVKECE